MVVNSRHLADLEPLHHPATCAGDGRLEEAGRRLKYWLIFLIKIYTAASFSKLPDEEETNKVTLK